MEADASWLQKAVAGEVLYEAEAPIVYTLVSGNQQHLVYLAEETPTGKWLLVAPATNASLLRLKRGEVSIRDALVSSWLWLAFADHDGHVQKVWPVDESMIPPAHLPVEGTPLLPEHEPVLSARAIGATILPGSTPSSVVAFLAGSARAAVKAILETVIPGFASGGRPTDESRSLYDLRIQRFAFRSFEAAFVLPPELFDRPELEQVASKLTKGLEWAVSNQDVSALDGSTDEVEAWLHAVNLLSPPSGGPIDEIRLSGAWIHASRAIVLTKDSRRRVRGALREMKADERAVAMMGRLGEVDRDNLSFILRDTDDGAEYRGTFAEEILDDVIDYFAEGKRVTVAGVKRSGKFLVSAISAQ